MRGIVGPLLTALVVGLSWPGGPLAFERLTEEELDRTVASGIEGPTANVPYRPEVVEASETEEGVIDDDDGEIEFVAYREALPIVMNRMTNTSYGPLGRHGSYSLSPLSVTRERTLPVKAPALLLGPFPRPNPPLFLGP